MNASKALPGERWLLYSPIGLRLVDDITGNRPFGPVRVILDRQDQAGNWHETTIKAEATPGGNLTYPGLERHPDVSGPARRYRCRIEAELYGSLYRALQDGIEFDAFPYNNTNAPANFPPPPNLPLPQDVVLTPGTNYPFPRHVLVLRGRIIDANGDAVSDAVVSKGIQERVLTDKRGAFALPLRWVQLNVQIPIDASHPRTGRTGLQNVTLPQDLGRNIEIQIN